ncbi:putative T6SS immunity periplasmic lipoprotein [Pantoea cypripedii]|uniref:DUF7480 domain-containing protein n=1 Tax=Pantoea cypripedii TaxID=55209 RepID=A0A6B9GCT4_PANCY|nr:putative T6SS immunity periplasmic lipoprotein [Pantoea cypripedii]QGY33260.1 hypothetical protein CUN67_25645 [Pantoea cypripedii]
MKKFIVLATAFLLSGCPGPGDRMVSRSSATATLKENNVCILSPMKPGEQIIAVQIYSDKDEKLIRTFEAKPVYVARGGCLPVFDYSFISGQKYSIAYDVMSVNSGSHLITVEFLKYIDSSGNIKVRNAH